MEEANDRLVVFLDADVLIAGAASTEGASHLVLRLGELGLIDLVSCAQVHSEVERNLTKKLPAALPAFALLARAACRWVDDADSAALRAVAGQADPKDAPILAAALREGCSRLLTFNTRHFKPKGKIIKVERPGTFLGRLRQILTQLAEPER